MDVRYDDEAESGFRGARVAVISAGSLGALCLAFLAGSAHGGDPQRAEPATTTVTATATPTRPTGGPTSVMTSPMLVRNRAGVIVGYSHDDVGAIAAAGNYTAALYVHTNRIRERESVVLRSISASLTDANRMTDDFATEDAALAKILRVPNLQAPGVIAYGHPQGYRVQGVDETQAVIDVYVVGGQGVVGSPTDSAGVGETFYEVDEVTLAWRDGDWRLQNWTHLVQNNGPEMATVAATTFLPFPIGQVGAR